MKFFSWRTPRLRGELSSEARPLRLVTGIFARAATTFNHTIAEITKFTNSVIQTLRVFDGLRGETFISLDCGCPPLVHL